MLATYEVKPGVYVLPSATPLGPMGLLPINAFLVKGPSSYLVDTGMVGDRQEFISRLESLIDPGELRFIVLTHTDPDHTGALAAVLARAPHARLVTNFVSSAKLELMGMPVAPDRLYLLNPGEEIDIAGVWLSAHKPATYDAPETIAVHDRSHDVLFSSDLFGAPLTQITPLANDLPLEELAANQQLWATFDSPWIRDIDRSRYAATLGRFMRMDPEWILSAHLPPAKKMIRRFCENLGGAPDAPPAPIPSQHEFMAMLAATVTAPAAGLDQPTL